jgi:hypothetical protein
MQKDATRKRHGFSHIQISISLFLFQVLLYQEQWLQDVDTGLLQLPGHWQWFPCGTAKTQINGRILHYKYLKN